MNLPDNYIASYSETLPFSFSHHVTNRIFDVTIEVDVFEYRTEHARREKAHAVFRNAERSYECDFCDIHNYESAFYPVVLNNRRLICFRKTLYGFTLLDAETLAEEYEYFPASVLHGDESFIITGVTQIDELLLFDGCYWACPYEYFVFDSGRKLFLDVSRAWKIGYPYEAAVKNGALILSGTGEDNAESNITVLKQELLFAIDKYGKADF